MAYAVVIGVGTPSGSASDVSPTTHASTVAGDLLLLAVESNANQLPASITGYTLVDDGTLGGTGSTGIAVWERIATGDSNDEPTIADVGNHLYAVILTIRGQDPTTPINASAGDAEQVTDTSGSSPGLTTTEDECLVIDFVATSLDSDAPAWSGWANADLANLDPVFEDGTTAGSGGGIAIHTGEKATAGTVAATTMTTPNDHKAFVKIAVAPAPSGAGSISAGTAGTAATVPGADLAASGSVELSVDVAGVAASVPGADVEAGTGSIAVGLAGAAATIPGADLVGSGSASLAVDVAGAGATVPGADVAASGSVALAVDVAGAAATVPGADLEVSGSAPLSVDAAGVPATVPGADLAASGSAPLAVDVAGTGATVPGADLVRAGVTLAVGVAGTGATVPGALVFIRGRVWAIAEFAAADASAEFPALAAIAEFEAGTPAVAEFAAASRLAGYASPTRAVEF